MKCTCGSTSVGSDKHSGYCDKERYIFKILEKDINKGKYKYLYVTIDSYYNIYQEAKEQLKNQFLMTMSFDECGSICFKNGSEVFFVSKDKLDKENFINFDGLYVDKCLEAYNFEKHLKPLAPVKYVQDHIVV